MSPAQSTATGFGSEQEGVLWGQRLFLAFFTLCNHPSPEVTKKRDLIFVQMILHSCRCGFYFIRALHSRHPGREDIKAGSGMDDGPPRVGPSGTNCQRQQFKNVTGHRLNFGGCCCCRLAHICGKRQMCIYFGSNIMKITLLCLQKEGKMSKRWNLTLWISPECLY